MNEHLRSIFRLSVYTVYKLRLVLGQLSLCVQKHIYDVILCCFFLCYAACLQDTVVHFIRNKCNFYI